MHKIQFCGEAISLRQTLPEARFLSSDDILAGSCCCDWRACQPGDVFFALTTADDDGHEHAAAALARGAVGVVGERLLPVEGPQVLVPDSRAALAHVCQALAGNPSRELRTIGLTGSAGKTTTAMLIASILEASGQAVGVMSSIGNSDSVVQHEPVGSTPTVPEFASWLARMQQADCDASVLEISSQALAEHRTSGIEFDAAVITNIQSGQLDSHNSPRAYQAILERIFDQLKTGGLAIVNADDHRCRRMLEKIQHPTLTYALHADADVMANVLERSASEQTFLLTAGSDALPVCTRMIGDHHVSNCLAAAAVGLALNMDHDAIVRGLEAVERVPGRLERLECGQPFGVFIDAASTVETLSRTVKTLRQVTRGRVLVVFGPSETTSSAQRALLGRVLERGCQGPIVTSSHATQNVSLHRAHEVLDGFDRPHKAHVIPNRRKAIHFALSQAREGDCVLIAGRSPTIATAASLAKDEIDDREVACEWLYNQGNAAPVTRRFRVVGY